MSSSGASSTSFMDLFNFHLATKLLGTEAVYRALQNSSCNHNSVELEWHKSMQITKQQRIHLFSVNFQESIRGGKKTLELRFGILPSPSVLQDHRTATIDENRYYLSSKPWEIQDLQIFFEETGIAVDEAKLDSVKGLAGLVASALSELQDASVKQIPLEEKHKDEYPHCIVQMTHPELHDKMRMHIHSEHDMAYGKIGPLAFPLLQKALEQQVSATVVEKNDVKVDEEQFHQWMNMTKCDDPTMKVKAEETTMTVEKDSLNADDGIINKSLDSSVKKEEQHNDAETRKRPAPVVRKGLVHGAIRTKKKKKKGKMTFQKLES
ncbi:predicted protein [Chaetoceros tenuissimus]|uniref:Uncharacterized protein n=1 Tax=Chaetoceros tenuissimus TaxID=426638 RepID=A0AAD3D5C9_9STRA|nr:predicted protein [Chaetoceros tenuissimus]